MPCDSLESEATNSNRMLSEQPTPELESCCASDAVLCAWSGSAQSSRRLGAVAATSRETGDWSTSCAGRAYGKPEFGTSPGKQNPISREGKRKRPEPGFGCRLYVLLTSSASTVHRAVTRLAVIE